MKKFVIYEIRNKINNFIYVGIHSTENVNDNYMGSGTRIKKAIEKEGVENFEKRILHIFDNKVNALEKEREIVNEEFIKRNDTYNLILGGGKYQNDYVTVVNEKGEFLYVHKLDERYLSGELKQFSKGYISVRDKDRNTMRVKTDDPRYLKGELVPILKNKAVVKDENGKKYIVDVNDERLLNGKLTGHSKNKVLVKNSKGEREMVDVNDSRYLSGELKFHWVGKKHNDVTKNKIGEKNSLKQQGEKNSQYGTCWIHKGLENKKIKKEDLHFWLKKNWFKGRKLK